MEKEKILKQKPHTSFNRRLSVVKNPEGNMITGKKKYLKNLFYRGSMTKGDMAKGITVFIIKFFIIIFK